MAVKQNRTLRETEEKIKRIKEAKEKAESDKKAKMARKKQLIDLSKDDDDQVSVFICIWVLFHFLWFPFSYSLYPCCHR